MLGSKPFCQSEDFVDLSRREDAPNPARVNDRKRSLDQVTLLNTATMNKVVTEEIEKLKLVAGECAMLCYELINRTRNSVGKAFEYLNTQNMADESKKRCLLMLVNSP
jgi:hypothetical protein